MEHRRLSTWLGRLRSTATFVYIAALCAAVALLVIGFIPRSPVGLELPTRLLTGLDHVGGVVSGAGVDPNGSIVFKIADPSLAQRLIYLLITVPGLFLVAEIARRLARLLRSAQQTDPFTAGTVRELNAVAKVTAIGGVSVWLLGTLAQWALSATVLSSGAGFQPRQSLLGWLAVGLIFAALAQIINRGVAMRAELDTVI